MPDTMPLAATAGAALLLLYPLNPRPRLVWNATPSAPIGLYAVSAPTQLRAGDLVVVRPPTAAARLAAVRDYVPLGVPLLKRIAAMPGERVCTDGAALWGPRGLTVQRLRRDRSGRVLPWWQGCGRMTGATYLLIMDRVQDSYDSRYFGPVARGRIVGKAHPLWLF